MIDSLLLRPSLHFPKLHPTTLPRILCNLGNKTSKFSIDKVCLGESDDTGSVTLQRIYACPGSVTLQGIYACPFINLPCRWHQLMGNPYLWHPFGPGIYLRLEREQKTRAGSWRWDRRLIYSHNFTVALVCRCSCSFDWSINRTGCCRWHPTATQTGHWSSHEPPHPAGTTLIILSSYLNLLQKAHQVTDGFNLVCKTGSLFVTLSLQPQCSTTDVPGSIPRQSPNINDLSCLLFIICINKCTFGAYGGGERRVDGFGGETGGKETTGETRAQMGG